MGFAKRLFAKYQAVLGEVTDSQEEFQNERTDLLDTIRLLTQNLKLKDLVISNFVPSEYCQKIERKATWSDDDDAWVIQRAEMSGNQIRNRSNRSLPLDKGRRNKSLISQSNIELYSENCISNNDGASHLDKVLAMGIDDNDEVGYGNETSTPYPYLQYEPGPSGGERKIDSDRFSSNKKREKEGSKTSRPRSASRCREELKSKK